MVTTVGMEGTLQGLLENLILLEHDAIAAYDTTIERLENPAFKAQIAEFRGDHERHLRELGEAARRIGIVPPEGGDMKQMLTTGKVALASMMGDRAILQAMRSNEEDTVTAYDRARRNVDVPPELRPAMERAYADEVRHRAWMQETSERL